MKILPYLLGTLSACGCIWFVVCLIWFRRWLWTNAANIVTGLGIKFCIGLLWVAIFYPQETLSILGLSIVVALTDWIDGPIARFFERKGYHGSVSNFGKGMDRFRDKFFHLTIFAYILSLSGVYFPIKLAIAPLMIVEIFLLIILILGMINNTDVSAGKWGKVKMFLASMGILACMTIVMIQERGVKISSFWEQGLVVIFLFSLFCAVMSFSRHVIRYKEQLRR